jgi:aryl-alcohol dehydrogenase-like predicted oxidoreductase
LVEAFMKLSASRRGFLTAGLSLPSLARSQSQPPARPAVQYRALGKTGLRVATVGYGTMIASDPTVIARAVDMGINYFDTARNYQNGQNERMVGVALAGRRNKVFLASKSSDNPSTGPRILAEIDTSLKELNTDYLDVWHLHGMDRAEDITDELVEAQRKAKQQGKIWFTGLSTHDLPAILDRAIQAHIEVVQVAYNFASAASYGPAIEKLHQAGAGVIAMKVMFKAAAHRARSPRMSYPSAALKWVIRNPAIATTVPSMTDADQLEENFRAMSERFTKADSKVLTARLEEIGPYFCRMCGNCRTGAVPEGLAGGPPGPGRHVRRRLRPVPVGPGTLSAPVGRASERPLQRLRDLRSALSERGTGREAVKPRTGSVRVLTVSAGLTHSSLPGRRDLGRTATSPAECAFEIDGGALRRAQSGEVAAFSGFIGPARERSRTPA